MLSTDGFLALVHAYAAVDAHLAGLRQDEPLTRRSRPAYQLRLACGGRPGGGVVAAGADAEHSRAQARVAAGTGRGASGTDSGDGPATAAPLGPHRCRAGQAGSAVARRPADPWRLSASGPGGSHCAGSLSPLARFVAAVTATNAAGAPWSFAYAYLPPRVAELARKVASALEEPQPACLRATTCLADRTSAVAPSIWPAAASGAEVIHSHSCGVHSRMVDSTQGGVESTEWGGCRSSPVRTTASGTRHRVRLSGRPPNRGAVRDPAGGAPAGRRAPGAVPGIVPVRVAVHRGAGPDGCRGEGVPETAQPLGREIEGFYVSPGLPQGPQRRQEDRLRPARLLFQVVVLGAGPSGASSCPGIAACWCATTSCARPRLATVEWGLTPPDVRAARAPRRWRSGVPGRRGRPGSPGGWKAADRGPRRGAVPAGRPG